MKIIFAIGNPGIIYRNTYHSLGLLFTDFLLKNHSILNKKAYKNSDFYQLNDYNIVQSNVFMNCSFDALREIFIFYKLKPEDILVVHDELGIAKFSFKIKYTEGLNGHNGLRDIAKNIGPKFPKLQIGVDHPKNFNHYLSVHDYVLSSLDINEWNESFKNGVNELNKFYI